MMNERIFTHKIRTALDEAAERLPPSTLKKLSSARNAALLNKRQEVRRAAWAQVGPAGERFANWFIAPFTGLQNMGLIVPVIAVFVGLIGMYQFEQQERISETAEIDALVLLDELPPSAYADRGFNAYLSNRGS